MGTPLADAVGRYLDRDPARLHMPGHKGRAVYPVGGAACLDITEVPGADSLYEASGPIAETEARYAALYGAAGTLLSAGGSTLCIQTMLALAAAPGQKVLCARGSHTAAVSAMALLDLHPEWIYPALDAATGLSLPVAPAQVEAALALHPDAAAVYLTSPNYYGTLCDIAALADVCHRHDVPLLVDGAHGAHLKFLSPDRHPIGLGADLCCDSLHKTLPVLTGGALLHIGNPRYLPDAKRRMSLFGSTSPSYLILLSIDGQLDRLERGVGAALQPLTERVAALEALAAGRGLLLPPGERDPIRLTLGFAPLGHDGASMRAHLERCGVEPEYLSDAFCVFLAGLHNSEGDFNRLRHVVETLPVHGSPRGQWAVVPPHAPVRALSLREAVFAPCEEIPVDAACGRVCAGTVSPCPPGIPLVLAGERLDNFLCDSLKRCGILSVNVIK